ncbi:MAG: choice-of-anchor D domain-containing protein [Sedimenticola sp.]
MIWDADVWAAQLIDTDGDTVDDSVDNCPMAPNIDQSDADGDGVGDVCDTNGDSDGDGILDDWEQTHFGNLTTASATSDSNGDGTTDLDHFNAGSNPNNGANPVGNSESYDVDLAQSINTAAPGVLDNDTDGDGDALTAVIETSPSHASAFTLNSDGSFDYTHDGTHTGNDSFSYKAYDGERYSTATTVTLVLHTQSQADGELSVSPGYNLFGDETLSDCSTSTPVSFTVSNSGSTALTLGNLSFDGPHFDQFQFGADNCSGQTIAGSGNCTVEVKFCPTSDGNKGAELHIPSDDAESPIIAVPLFNNESEAEEARRRMPPVLNGLRIMDGTVEETAQLHANTAYTIEWSLLGYHDSYRSVVALFDCSETTTGNCGNSYSENFLATGLLAADTTQAGSWTYGSQTSTQFNFSTSFTPSVSRFGTVKDLVLRFYHLSSDDQASGQGGLSLIIPGNIAGTYYDQSGRRIQRQVGP